MSLQMSPGLVAGQVSCSQVYFTIAIFQLHSHGQIIKALCVENKFCQIMSFISTIYGFEKELHSSSSECLSQKAKQSRCIAIDNVCTRENIFDKTNYLFLSGSPSYQKLMKFLLEHYNVKKTFRHACVFFERVFFH